MSTIIYGIASCDTMKKARRWLDAHSVDYEFHDYKKRGVGNALLKTWCAEEGWEVLVNRRGTTWRKLPDADKEGITTAKAVALMEANTSLIKRPVLEHGDKRLVGFDENGYTNMFS
ncbi:MAG: ArsC family reductase [Granulosicoccus sp.]